MRWVTLGHPLLFCPLSHYSLHAVSYNQGQRGSLQRPWIVSRPTSRARHAVSVVRNHHSTHYSSMGHYFVRYAYLCRTVFCPHAHDSHHRHQAQDSSPARGLVSGDSCHPLSVNWLTAGLRLTAGY